jgi:hypothetical protein
MWKQDTCKNIFFLVYEYQEILFWVVRRTVGFVDEPQPHLRPNVL